MNSIIQSLYHCESFRGSIINLHHQSKSNPTKADSFTALNEVFTSLNTSMNNKKGNIGSCSAIVNYLSISPGVQEDAQEFYLRLINTLSSDSKVTSILEKSSIIDLFLGQNENYIDCRDVPVSRKKIQRFKDISLSVQPTLHASLMHYLRPDLLDGDNKYKTEEYGKQVAYKGTRLMHLPRVLVFQINRFTYDLEMGSRYKVCTHIYTIVLY